MWAMGESAADDVGLAFSRPRATAKGLGELAPDRNRFTSKRVLLTGEPAALATSNGRVMLLMS